MTIGTVSLSCILFGTFDTFPTEFAAELQFRNRVTNEPIAGLRVFAQAVDSTDEVVVWPHFDEEYPRATAPTDSNGTTWVTAATFFGNPSPGHKERVRWVLQLEYDEKPIALEIDNRAGNVATLGFLSVAVINPDAQLPIFSNPQISTNGLLHVNAYVYSVTVENTRCEDTLYNASYPRAYFVEVIDPYQPIVGLDFEKVAAPNGCVPYLATDCHRLHVDYAFPYGDSLDLRRTIPVRINPDGDFESCRMTLNK